MGTLLRTGDVHAAAPGPEFPNGDDLKTPDMLLILRQHQPSFSSCCVDSGIRRDSEEVDEECTSGLAPRALAITTRGSFAVLRAHLPRRLFRTRHCFLLPTGCGISRTPYLS